MTIRVFLVEDFRNMEELVSELLSSLGGMELVGSAATEAEAKLWLDENPGEWDVTLVDLVLQVGSGLDVIARAKRTSPSGLVAVFSSFVSPAVDDHCIRLGADIVCHKEHPETLVKWLVDLKAEPA
jgi:two-component system, OmpR family, response regulator